MTTSDKTAIASLLIGVVGLFVIWFQLRQSANSAKATLLMSVNRDLNAYLDVAVRIEQSAGEHWVTALAPQDKERLLDYISYFEGLYLSHRSGLFSMSDVNDYFAGRFFRVVNNVGVQKGVLLDSIHGDIFRPVFCLHAELTKYRQRRGLSPLYAEHDLRAGDSALYSTYVASLSVWSQTWRWFRVRWGARRSIAHLPPESA